MHANSIPVAPAGSTLNPLILAAFPDHRGALNAYQVFGTADRLGIAPWIPRAPASTGDPLTAASIIAAPLASTSSTATPPAGGPPAPKHASTMTDTELAAEWRRLGVRMPG